MSEDDENFILVRERVLWDGEVPDDLQYDESRETLFKREAVEDMRLKFDARGVLFYIASMPPDYEISIEDLMNEGGCGRDETVRLLKVLHEAGYLSRV